MLVDGTGSRLRPARAGDRQHPDAAADPRAGADRRAAAPEGARVPQPGRLPRPDRPRSRRRASARSSSAAACSASRSPGRSSVRGVETEVVEGAEHLLHQQVGEHGRHASSSATSRGSAPQVYTGARAVRLTDDGLRLDNGYTLDTDLVVLTAGGRPSTALARRAGLMVRRGVVVDEHLRVGHRRATSTPSATAPSTAAAPPASCRPPGSRPRCWPARWPARTRRTTGRADVARLRATGLDVAVMGDPERTDGDVVEVANPIIGSHRKVVVSDGVLVAGAY